MTTWRPSGAIDGDDGRAAGGAFIGDANVTTNEPSAASRPCARCSVVLIVRTARLTESGALRRPSRPVQHQLAPTGRRRGRPRSCTVPPPQSDDRHRRPGTGRLRPGRRDTELPGLHQPAAALGSRPDPHCARSGRHRDPGAAPCPLPGTVRKVAGKVSGDDDLGHRGEEQLEEGVEKGRGSAGPPAGHGHRRRAGDTFDPFKEGREARAVCSSSTTRSAPPAITRGAWRQTVGHHRRSDCRLRSLCASGQLREYRALPPGSHAASHYPCSGRLAAHTQTPVVTREQNPTAAAFTPRRAPWNRSTPQPYRPR